MGSFFYFNEIFNLTTNHVFLVDWLSRSIFRELIFKKFE
ncbi:hypothetical protein FHS59_001217 [Algoriphagus iocasae]|uniref:Uncharacterized protein n=1 Tax=Algoriphagus iocasae TaxID=1836499 RepID=A0A841MC30_9BACT|nr:hypothetical protein [Algoriphagus iocasae]